MKGGPYLVIPTRKGAVPCLTPTQAREIMREDERIISLSVFDAADYIGACSKLDMSFAAFCGLAEFKVLLTLRTSFLGLHASAASTEAGIAGDHERGRSTITVDKWRETVLAVKPDVAMGLSESISLAEPPSKKRRTAVTRCVNWTKKMEEMEASVPDCVVLKSVVGTSGGESGFLDCFARNETTLEMHAGLKSLSLSPEKPSYVSAYSMPAVLAAIDAGVQLVESTLPWELADKGIALTFRLAPPPRSGDKTEEGEVEMNLNDDDYTVDIRPLGEQCTCYTCKRHNRAYIHHLLTVQEMNGSILLAIHNLHMLVQVFRRARELGGDAAKRSAILEAILAQY